MSWTSTCVSNLQRMLDLGLTADVLAEKLFSLPPETLISAAKHELGSRGFDVAGVQDHVVAEDAAPRPDEHDPSHQNQV